MANTFTSYYDADVASSAANVFQGATDDENVISSLFITNIDGTNAANIIISVTNAAASNEAGASGVLKYYVAYNLVVPPKTTVTLMKPIFMESNDKLWLKANAAGDLSVGGSVLKIDN